MGATDEGWPYFVMEYVAGEPIDRYCDRNRLPIEARLLLFDQVCAAVQHAHTRQVIHRDLKPNNILVTAAGEVKLLDFGIAHSQEMPRTLTQRGHARHDTGIRQPGAGARRGGRCCQRCLFSRRGAV
ncbi:MAG: protein kinase [Bryobacterales bacterium]|nr:protein kinase [Bryobacterales bacterium]